MSSNLLPITSDGGFITDGNITTGNLSATGNGTFGNITTSGSDGNISGANVISGNTISASSGLTSTGVTNLGAVGNVTITGGSTGQYLQTDGAGVLSWATVTTGSTSNISNGNSNVSIATSNGNVTINSSGNTTMTVTGTGANITGTLSVSANSNVGNLGTDTLVATTGNITTINSGLMQNGNSNVTIGANSSVTIYANGTSHPWTFGADGNLTVPESGQIRAGSPFYGISIVDYSNNSYLAVDNAGATLQGNGLVRLQLNSGQQFDFTTGLANLNSANLVTTGNISGGNLSVSGNATVGNLVTGGNISATGNGTFGNITTGGTAGNISGANVISANIIVASANANLGNLVTANYFSGNGVSITGLTLGNSLTDVVLTSPQPNQILEYNGVEWVNADNTSSVSAGQGVGFWITTPVIIPNNSANNFNQLDTLSSSPNTSAQSYANATINGTGLISASRSSNLGRSILDAGNWDYSIWANVDNTGGTSSLALTTHTTTPFPLAGTVTITGTGTSRTVTASADSPFANSTAGGGNIVLSSYVETPTGLFPITAVANSTSVTVTTPSTYVNESSVNGYTWDPLFHVGSADLNSTSIVEYLFGTTQSSFTVANTSGIGIVMCGITSASRTIYTTINGSTQSSHIATPLATLHNSLAGLQGGQSTQYYHLTNSEYTGTGSGVFARATSPQLTTPNVGAATGTSLSVSGNILAGNVYANSGTIGASLLTGTLTTNSQPNITSTGTLISLSVSGNSNVGNIGATGGVFTTVAGTLTTQAQPNITSTGTLTSLSVSGNSNVGNIGASGVFTGNGSGLSSLAVANIVGLGNIATINKDGNASNILYGNGVFATTPAFKYTKEWHVDPVNGSDTNTGAYEKPFLTISQALTSAGNVGCIIYLHAGTYAENVTVTNLNLDIVGLTAGGGVINLSGTWDYAIASGSIRVEGVYHSGAVTISATGDSYFTQCTFGSTLTKSGGGYVSIQASNCQGTGISVTGAGIVAFLNGLQTSLTVNNASASVTLQSTQNLTTAVVTSGTLTVQGGLVFSSGATNNAITSAAGSIVVLGSTRIFNNAGALGRTNLLGFWTINDVQYDKANSTNSGTNLDTTSYFDKIVTIGNITANFFTGTLTTNSQPNITSVGTLASLSVTANANVGNLNTTRVVATGNISGTQLISNIATGTAPLVVTSTTQVANLSVATAGTATTAGTVTTNAQPNITSTGTLTSLSVSGNITGGNIIGPHANGNSNVNIATSNGNVTITAVGNTTLTITGTGANITGTISASGNSNVGNIGATGGVFTTVAGSLTTNSQPNITSTGTLTTLSVSGNSNIGNIGTGIITATGNITGANLIAGSGTGGNITGANLVSANYFAGVLTTQAQPNITSTGTLTSLSVSGNITGGNLTVVGSISVNSKVAVNGPAFSAYANATAQTITTGSQQKVLFQTEEFDTNNNYASSQFTPTVEGYYQLNAEVRLDGDSGTGEVMIVLYKNGAEYKRGTNQSGVKVATNFWAMTVSSLAYANGTGDYFEIYVQQTSGSSINVTAVNNPALTWFNGSMIRGA